MKYELKIVFNNDNLFIDKKNGSKLLKLFIKYVAKEVLSENEFENYYSRKKEEKFLTGSCNMITESYVFRTKKNARLCVIVNERKDKQSDKYELSLRLFFDNSILKSLISLYDNIDENMFVTPNQYTINIMKEYGDINKNTFLKMLTEGFNEQFIKINDYEKIKYDIRMNILDLLHLERDKCYVQTNIINNKLVITRNHIYIYDLPKILKIINKEYEND